MNAGVIQDILRHISCRDLVFVVKADGDGEAVPSGTLIVKRYLYLQVEAPRADVPAFIFNKALADAAGIGQPPQLVMKGRKWRLSEHMTTSEIVQTAFAAALHFEEHELRENFSYRGQAVFGPHFDVDDLVALAAVRGKAGARP